MFLSLDTSSGVSVAVYDPSNHLVYGEDFIAGGRHTEQLMPLIDETLGHVAIVRAALTGICVGTGPGPFTGLRVGLSTARTLGFALGVPVHGVCSLAALAFEAAAGGIFDGVFQAPLTDGSVVGVAIDARRKEVYHAAYRVERGASDAEIRLTEILPPAVAKPQVAAAALVAAGAGIVVGEGVEIYADEFVSLPVASGFNHANAGVLARYAQELLAVGADLSDTSPLYLRKPDAEEPSGRKSALRPR